MKWQTVRDGVSCYVKEDGRIVGYVAEGCQSRVDAKWILWVAYYEGRIHGDYIGQREAMSAIEKVHSEIMQVSREVSDFMSTLPGRMRSGHGGGSQGGGTVQ